MSSLPPKRLAKTGELQWKVAPQAKLGAREGNPLSVFGATETDVIPLHMELDFGRGKSVSNNGCLVRSRRLASD
jgi:hypothetical protein